MDRNKKNRPGVDDRKPMARVVRIPLFRRKIVETLNLAAMEVLLAGARKLSEGQLAQPRNGPLRYDGSTMLTIDLRQAEPFVRNPLDAATAIELAHRCISEPALLSALKQIAQTEAERLAGRRLSSVEIEIKTHAQKEQILIDLDVEATVASRLHATSPRRRR
ncbi:MAG: hypothetical protein J7M25_12910 [Deltaproteobacteria bacterium]|nr:hypothetical protein [Deltaproteobacteria bacterium]